MGEIHLGIFDIWAAEEGTGIGGTSLKERLDPWEEQYFRAKHLRESTTTKSAKGSF